MKKKPKVAMVISFRDFRDEELFVPMEILNKAGIEIKVISNKKGLAIGADGGEIEVNILASELKVEEFDAIIFIGGPGCLKNLDNEISYEIIRQTIHQGKILAGICISPVILAKAGALKGKRATVWSNSMDKSAIKILKENGAIYQKEPVVVDGNIITSSGPSSAKDFAGTLDRILKKNILETGSADSR